MTRPPIFLVGEFRTSTDARADSCFISAGGAELIRMLGEAGVIRLTAYDQTLISAYYRENDLRALDRLWSLHPSLHRTNVFQIHPDTNDLDFFLGGKADAIPGYPALLKSRYVRREFEPELDRLCAEILAHDPNLIICLGNTPLWALAGKVGVTKVRGTTLLSTHTVADYKLLATYHPSAIIRQWENRPTMVADLMKAKREAEFPDVRRPPREIWIEPTLDDIITFRDQFITRCDLLSTDIETSGQRITCIGFAPNPHQAIVIPFDDSRSKDGCYWPTRELEYRVWGIIRGILEDASIPKLFQNGAYDISFLWRSYGIKTLGAREDTMLLSHALQPESLKGLGYLGSIYSDEGSWKHMRVKHETVKKDD